MVQDIYDEIRTISEELRAAGESQSADNLDKAISYVGLGSEILGEIRLQLRRLRDDGISQRLHLEKRVNEVLEHLDERLRLY